VASKHSSCPELYWALDDIASRLMRHRFTSRAATDRRGLHETVIGGGYCVGCGACAAYAPAAFEMTFDRMGTYVARLKSPSRAEHDLAAERVCPFSRLAENEDRLAAELFGGEAAYHPEIGYHRATYAGYVAEGQYRERGSSGGMGSWIPATLLAQGFVDAVVHVHSRVPTDADQRLFELSISRTAHEVVQHTKSQYHPVEMSAALQQVRSVPGRYAIVGVPCFVKAVRLLAHHDEVVRQRIVFTVGLVCGHLKSLRFAQMMAWQMGIAPADLRAFDFRTKLPGRPANRYGVTAAGTIAGQPTAAIRPVYDLFGTDWGMGFFKLKACDYCDDVVAETADVTVGDAWLPEYNVDSAGTNIVIVRNSVIAELVEAARADGRLVLESISADRVAQSQRGGFFHRRNGLAYRLYLDDADRRWRPPKRVPPSRSECDRSARRRMTLRVRLAEQSHTAFEAALEASDLQVFFDRMMPLVREYRRLYQPTLPRRALSGVRRILDRVKARLSFRRA
jgi:coenzyme F420 hydrogenase subunit beta